MAPAMPIAGQIWLIMRKEADCTLRCSDMRSAAGDGGGRRVAACVAVCVCGLHRRLLQRIKVEIGLLKEVCERAIATR